MSWNISKCFFLNYKEFLCKFVNMLLINKMLTLVKVMLGAIMQQAINLTHWGQVTHICVSNLTIIGSDNGLSPARPHAITWTNVGTLLIGPLGTNFSEIFIAIHTFSFKKIHLKMLSKKWRPFCLSLNVLNHYWANSFQEPSYFTGWGQACHRTKSVKYTDHNRRHQTAKYMHNY